LRPWRQLVIPSLVQANVRGVSKARRPTEKAEIFMIASYAGTSSGEEEKTAAYSKLRLAVK
jgi:hypothetical protein